GTVIIRLTTDDPTGPCPNAISTVVITVQNCSCGAPPIADAGAPQTTCAGTAVTLAGTISGSATSATWTAPSGGFANSTQLGTTYMPSITSGTVNLTLTTNDPDGAGPCTP